MRLRRWALRSAITLPCLIALLLAGCGSPATTSASAPAAASASPRSGVAGKRRPGRVRAVRSRRELAAAAAGWRGRRQARGLDLGIGRRGLRRDAGPDLDRAARRAAAAGGREAVDAVRLLQPSRGNATGNTDGMSATCEPAAKRGWERRWHHSVFVVDRNGKMVEDWPHLEKMFSQTPAGAARTRSR